MKRKKSPIALISVLVVACLGLVIAGPGFAFFSKSAQDQQAELQKQAMERAKANAEKPTGKVDANKEVQQMKADMKKGLKAGGGRNPVTPKLDDEDGGPSSVPTMVMPVEDDKKPQPNTAAPSSQWYGAGK